ncbi:MAG: hypothetical protein ABIK07_09550 [Planctomycetota bacterium]
MGSDSEKAGLLDLLNKNSYDKRSTLRLQAARIKGSISIMMSFQAISVSNPQNHSGALQVIA